MNKINLTIIFFLLCLTITKGYSQESHGGTPLMFNVEQNNLRGLLSSDTIIMQKSALSIAKRTFSVIDSEREKIIADSVALIYGHGKGKYYGKGIDVNIDFKQEATMQLLGDTGKLYLLELTSATATALQVYFDAFKIPRGSRMFIYDSDRTMFIGSFTHDNNFINNRLGTQYILGNSLIIEYYEPNIVEYESQLHIETLVHVFIDLKNGPFASSSGSGTCNINVTCPLGYAWEREKRSVAIILGYSGTEYQYYGWCSGALINNTAQNGRPLFLTANHCIDNAPSIGMDMDNTTDWVFLFNHEATTCNEDGSWVSSSLYQAIYGANILSKDSYCSPTSDYLLLDLNVSPSTLASYNVLYAGWDADENNGANTPYSIGIHHPSGDVKKISKDADSPVSISHPNVSGCPNSGIAGTHWQVIWDEGVTEGGSSGSPLFNSDHKIIGQLHSGSSSCNNPSLPDQYGKFSYSFVHGNFAQWLDPYYSSARSMGDYNPSQINDNCYNGVQDGNETGIDCGGNCPPCTWANSGNGWNSNHCTNGVKDSDETGIDCGGSCKPCITVIQCNNCSKDGNETGIDCGGSCPPCNIGCTHTQKTYTTSDIPSVTAASNSISAHTNVVIQSGQNVTFKAANSIILGPGFTAHSGSKFSAFIAPCNCKEPCDVKAPNVFTPNGDGINDNLCYIASGYNRYSVVVYNRYGQTIFQSSGNVENNIACIWNGSNSANMNVYSVITTFYSDCAGISNDYSHSINVFKSIANLNEEETEIYQTEIPFILKGENITLYPNPTVDIVNINIENTEDVRLIEIKNIRGNIILKMQDNIISEKTSIDISAFPTGIYMVTVVLNSGTQTFKIIKK